MKKFNSILLIMIMIISSVLTGCTTNENLISQAEETKKETIEETLSTSINYEEISKSSVETIIETTIIQESTEETTQETKEEITESSVEENINEYSVAYEEPAINNEQTEPVTETPTIQFTNRIIDNFGSYENYEDALIAEINKLRAGYGYQPVVKNTYIKEITSILANYSAKTGLKGHLGCENDYETFKGIYSSAESVGYYGTVAMLDVAFIAYTLTIDHTKEIVTNPNMKYIGVTVMPFNRVNDIIVIDTVTEDEYNKYIIGNESWGEFYHGELHFERSRFAQKNNL